MNACSHPTHHATRQLDRSTHFHTTTQQSPHWLQWVAANSPPKLPLPFNDHHRNLIHPFRTRPYSPPQTASRSNQPFCHNSHVHTDTWDKRMSRNMSASLRERRANNTCVERGHHELHRTKLLRHALYNQEAYKSSSWFASRVSSYFSRYSKSNSIFFVCTN